MSSLEVKVCRLNLFNHPNADSLMIAKIKDTGYTAIVGKDQFIDNDLCIFIPYDAVVPENICEWLKRTSKIDIHNGRVRCCRIRQVFSDGLCLSPENWLKPEDIVEGKEVSTILGIKKYEPHESTPGLPNSKSVNHWYQNPNFKKYTEIENIKRFCGFQENEEVVATIKYHGSNSRYSYIARPINSLTTIERIKRFFGFKIQDKEELVGSHNMIRRENIDKVEDHFHKVNSKYGLTRKAKVLSGWFDNKDVIIYGEVIGVGIQKFYDYGCKPGDFEIRVFDIMIDGRYLDWDTVARWCHLFNLPIVDVVYRGPWSSKVIELASAVDRYGDKEYVREGIVVKPIKERNDKCGGRIIYKIINPTYLLNKKNTDNK